MPIAPAMTPMQDEMPPMGGSPLDVEIVPDGPSDMPTEEPLGEDGSEHRANLAEFLEDGDLAKIASDLVELVEGDEMSRADWIETYSSGLDYLGFKGEDRDQPFKGSSGVYHPVMTEAVVRFQSNAIMEIFPANGPVLTKMYGDETPEKVNIGKRVKEEMNYQLTENMKEYRNETEQLLFRLPLAGSVFKKVYYDPLKKRPSACMVPAEDFIVDYGAAHRQSPCAVGNPRLLQPAGYPVRPRRDRRPVHHHHRKAEPEGSCHLPQLE
jgi:hypothetical protein